MNKDNADLLKERERFEAWAAPFGMNIEHAAHFSDYRDGTTWKMWKAWQAASPKHEAVVADRVLIAEMVKQKCFSCDCGISDELWDSAIALQLKEQT